jgi:hypothetical protein
MTPPVLVVPPGAVAPPLLATPPVLALPPVSAAPPLLAAPPVDEIDAPPLAPESRLVGWVPVLFEQPTVTRRAADKIKPSLDAD